MDPYVRSRLGLYSAMANVRPHDTLHMGQHAHTATAHRASTGDIAVCRLCCPGIPPKGPGGATAGMHACAAGDLRSAQRCAAALCSLTACEALRQVMSTASLLQL